MHINIEILLHGVSVATSPFPRQQCWYWRLWDKLGLSVCVFLVNQLLGVQGITITEHINIEDLLHGVSVATSPFPRQQCWYWRLWDKLGLSVCVFLVNQLLGVQGITIKEHMNIEDLLHGVSVATSPFPRQQCWYRRLWDKLGLYVFLENQLLGIKDITITVHINIEDLLYGVSVATSPFPQQRCWYRRLWDKLGLSVYVFLVNQLLGVQGITITEHMNIEDLLHGVSVATSPFPRQQCWYRRLWDKLGLYVFLENQLLGIKDITITVHINIEDLLYGVSVATSPFPQQRCWYRRLWDKLGLSVYVFLVNQLLGVQGITITEHMNIEDLLHGVSVATSPFPRQQCWYRRLWDKLGLYVFLENQLLGIKDITITVHINIEDLLYGVSVATSPFPQQRCWYRRLWDKLGLSVYVF